MTARRMRRGVMVTGANGFIGSALVAHFAARGDAVIAAARRAPDPLPDGAAWRAYDLLWRDLPADFFDGVDVLIHGATIRGDVHANVAGSTLLLERAQAAGVEHVVFLSSLAAHEGALSTYGRQKFALQQLYASRGALVLRPGLVLGEGGAFRAMCAYLRTHRLVPVFGGGNQPLQTVTIDDLVAAVDRAIASGARGTFTVATRTPVTYREFYRLLSAHLGTSVVFVPVPFWLAGIALRVAAALHISLPIDRDNLLGLQAMRADAGPWLS